MKYLIRVPVPRMAGPYKAHQTVYEACQEGPLVWRRFSDHALVLSPAPVDAFPCKPYDPSPVNGQRLRFDLLAEIAKADGKPKNGETRSPRIDPVLKAWIAADRQSPWRDVAFDQGALWLEKRQEGLGLEASLDVADYNVLEFVRAGKTVRVGTINYQGILTVKDADKLKATLLKGVGHSKAWGCGLLLCHRIDNN